MPRFCRQCGAENHPAAKFCEACGKPCATPTITPANSAPASVAAPFGNKKLIGLVLLGVLGLLVGGGLLAYFLAPEAANAENFTKAISAYYRDNPSARDERICLDNFDYGEDPVRTSAWDDRTNRWMAFLVRNGIYEQPRAISVGWFGPHQYEFKMTEAGRNRVKGDRLCFADDVIVTAIVDFSEPDRNASSPMSVVTFKLDYVNPAPWTQSEDARRLLPHVFGEEARYKLVLKRLDGKWRVIED